MMPGLIADRRSVLAGALAVSSGLLVGATGRSVSSTTVVVRQPGYHLSQRFAEATNAAILFLTDSDPLRSRSLAAVLADRSNRIIGLTDWTAFAALREIGQEYGRRVRHEGRHVPSDRGWEHTLLRRDTQLQKALNRASGHWLDLLTHELVGNEAGLSGKLSAFPDVERTMFSWSMD